MNRKLARFNLAASVFTLTLLAEAAQAASIQSSYFVRPVLRIGAGEIIDGRQVNGPTTGSLEQSVVGNSESAVNLTNGTVKMYAQESAAETGLQTFGAFGERLTINGGAGTNWDLSFGLEGDLYGQLGPRAPSPSSPPLFFYDLSIVVFNQGVADSTNFFALARDACWGQDPLNCSPVPAPLAYEYVFESIPIPVDDYDPFGDDSDNEFYIDVYDEIFASIELASNHEVLDIFVFTNMWVAPNGAGNGLESYFADFSNTATYSQQFAPGVEAFSSSGQFLGLAAPPVTPSSNVPAPGGLLLIAIGLLGLGVSRRRMSANTQH